MGANRSSLSLAHAIIFAPVPGLVNSKEWALHRTTYYGGSGLKWGLNVRRLGALVGGFIHLGSEFSGLLDKARRYLGISRCLGELEKDCRLTRKILFTCHCNFPR
jgi:hypothetical protein